MIKVKQLQIFPIISFHFAVSVLYLEKGLNKSLICIGGIHHSFTILLTTSNTNSYLPFGKLLQMLKSQINSIKFYSIPQ